MAAISRRTLLSRTALVVALGGGAALGLTKHVHHKVNVPPTDPPLALRHLSVDLSMLLTRFNSVTQAGITIPLPPLRNQLRAHGDAVGGLLENYPGYRLDHKEPSIPAVGARSAAELIVATKAVAAAASAACLAWPATEANAAQVVPVLGSIAAGLTTIEQVLA